MLLQLQTFSFDGIQNLLTYWPMENVAEPNTSLFSRYLNFMVPGLQTAYPVSNFTDATMQALIVDEDTDFTTNTYGITEPKQGAVINAIDIDLVFVPFLACDKKGYRVGFGKGFYDRYLAQCREDVVLMGFSYFEPIDAISDTNEFDIPLSFCITPNEVYEFDHD